MGRTGKAATSGAGMAPSFIERQLVYEVCERIYRALRECGGRLLRPLLGIALPLPGVARRGRGARSHVARRSKPHSRPAGIAQSLVTSDYTSVQERLEYAQPESTMGPQRDREDDGEA